MTMPTKQLFIPAKSRREAEDDAPRWACRFAKVIGGFVAFDSQPALEAWRDDGLLVAYNQRLRD
jgi:hypothetical protein